LLFDPAESYRCNERVHIQRLGQGPLGRQFGWLWAAFAVSAYGSGIGFGAFPIIAVRVLHAGPIEVSALSSAGLAVGAAVAVPLGPWVEFRRKRPVMMAMDLARFLALLTIPAAYALGRLSFAQLLVVSIVVAAGKIAFNAASGANLKAVVKPEDLLVANSRFESTTWTALVVGPPLGGALVGLLGPVTTVIADAVSYLLSACGVAMIGGGEPRPARSATARHWTAELLDGWRHILTSPALRPVFYNRMLVGGLISPCCCSGSSSSRPGSTPSRSAPRVSAASSAPGWPAGSSPGSGGTGSCWPSGRWRPAGRLASRSWDRAWAASSLSSASSSGSSSAWACITR
jgi:hypothetical protein